MTHGPHSSCKQGRGIVFLLVLPELYKLFVTTRLVCFLGLGLDLGYVMVLFTSRGDLRGDFEGDNSLSPAHTRLANKDRE